MAFEISHLRRRDLPKTEREFEEQYENSRRPTRRNLVRWVVDAVADTCRDATHGEHLSPGTDQQRLATARALNPLITSMSAIEVLSPSVMEPNLPLRVKLSQ